MSFTINIIKKLPFGGLGGLFLLFFLFASSAAKAQNLTHSFRNTSLSDALIWIDKAQNSYKINFIFDELEDFTVTTSFKNTSVKEAVKQVIGFYPMRISYEKKEIYVECVQKAATKLTGHVVDENGLPLSFATVSLLSVADSSFITGGVSNENGDFVVPCQMKQIIAKVTSIGYKTVTRKATVGQMGTIAMQPETYTVKGVVVKGSIPHYKKTTEGISTTVEGSVLSQLGTAEDVLHHIPGITKNEKDNRIEVFGKGEPIIYINGRKMRGIGELTQLKSTDIKNIEIITTPGAKYDATVNAIVKIQTVRKAGDGFSVDAWGKWSQGKYGKEDASLDLNYRTNGLDLFGSIRANKHKTLFESTPMYGTVKGDTLWEHTVYQCLTNDIKTVTLEGGFNYQIDENNMIGAKYTSDVLSKSGDEPSYTFNDELTGNGKFYDHLNTVANLKQEKDDDHRVNAYYNGKVGKLGIDLNMDYLYDKSHDNQDIVEISTVLDNRQLSTSNIVENRLFASKLTMTYPIFGGSLDFGVEYTNTHRQDDYINPEQYVATSHSTQKERNTSPYAEFSRMIPIGLLRAGIRYENVSMSRHYINGNETDKETKNYGDWYPSISLGTQIGKVQMQLGYSAKTTRPTYAQLGNYMIYANRYSMQTGNPMLNNSTRHTVSLQGMWKWMQFSLDYTNERNPILYWVDKNLTDEKVTVVTHKNIHSLKSINTLVAVAPAFGIWHPQLALGSRMQWLTIETINGKKRMNNPLPFAQFNNAFAFGHGFTGELNFEYQGEGDYQNGHLDYNMTKLNVSIVKTFMNDHLSLKVAGEDLLNRGSAGNKILAQNMEMYQLNHFDTRRFVVSLRYTFNTTKSKYKGTGAGNEEKARLQQTSRN